MNYIPNDIEGMGGIRPDAGTLFIDGGSAFISTEGWNGGREGIRD